MAVNGIYGVLAVLVHVRRWIGRYVYSVGGRLGSCLFAGGVSEISSWSSRPRLLVGKHMFALLSRQRGLAISLVAMKEVPEVAK
jgi:hypothetical protein